MKQDTKTQMKVGVFLSIGLFVILASIFMLGADKVFFKNYMRLHAHFDQIQGLSEGSVVSLSGVPVGNIEKIDFSPDKNMLDLTLRVDKTFAHRIPKDSQLEIRTQGALGDKFIFIIPGEMGGETVKEGDILAVAPATDILGILSEKGKDAGRVFDIINEIYKMTQTMNANGRMEKIMTNLSQASASFNASATDAKKFFGEVDGAGSGKKFANSIDRMESIMTKIDRGDGTLGALINDSSIHNQIKNMLGAPTRKNNLKSLIRTSIEKEND